ncbi:MAG: DNA polymerase-3 subunit alpha, partial [Candidatus Azotimanducaceae bacterium]
MKTDPRFIHLRTHSEYSLLEGALRLKKLPGLCV